MKTSTLIITIIVVLLVASAGAALFWQAQRDETSTNGDPAQTEESTETPTPEPEGLTGDDTVAIRDFAFQPANITVPLGTTVTWTNEDSAGHNVIAVDADNSGGLPGEDAPLLSEGESFSHTFDEVGTFEYLCEPHPYMRGTVEVVATEEEM